MNPATNAVVYGIIRDHDGSILLALQSSGEFAGLYSLPCGQILPVETYSAAVVRVALREVGAQLSQDEVGFTYMQQRYEAPAGTNATIWTDVFFEAGPWKGELHNSDPETQAKIVWFYPDELPENIVPHQRYAVERITGEHLYGEYGWPTQT